MNNEYKLEYLINDCLIIENTIKEIIETNDIISKFKELNNYEFKFEPEEIEETNELIQIIKKFGKIKEKRKLVFNDSLILNKNKTYIENLKDWINPIKDFETKLLYRTSTHGENYTTFHDLCDNQGSNLIIIKSKEWIHYWRLYSFGFE